MAHHDRPGAGHNAVPELAYVAEDACFDGPGDAVRDTAEIAWLDSDGVIEAVNAAWGLFCHDNGGDPARCGVGVSYLAVCEGLDTDPGAASVGSAIRSAVRGDLAGPVAMLISCDSPTEARWFDVLVGPRFDTSGALVGATVTLSRAAGHDGARRARG